MNEPTEHEHLARWRDVESFEHGVAQTGVDELLTYLRETRGFDLSGHKRAALQRCLATRLHALQLSGFAEYLDYIEVHPEEFGRLQSSAFQNATGFLRDPSVWELLSAQVVPRVLDAKADEAAPIRVWSAGTGTGQEAHTMAMILCDRLGLSAFCQRVKIYATDIDPDALAQGRQATYSAEALQGIPPEWLDKYFGQHDELYTLASELRRCVAFARHDLLSDAPIPRIDLLLCRNTLLSFNGEAQSRILRNLHFSLSATGVLVLGCGEMLLAPTTLFAPLDLQRGVFAKIAAASHALRVRPVVASEPLRRPDERARPLDERARPLDERARIRELGFDAAPVPQIAVDQRGMVVLANELARRQFGVHGAELGCAASETELFQRLSGLRSGVEQAGRERRPVQVATAWQWGPDESNYYDVVAAPLLETSGSLLGALVSFTPVSAVRRLQEALDQASHELEAAYDELQCASEELETTNQALRSTNEELETTNAELQSANEQLETANEELRAANDELQEMNEAFRSRTGELTHLNVFLESILASLRGAVVVLDSDLRIQVWNERAFDMWGVRAAEVHTRGFLTLDVGLPVRQLASSIHQCLMTGEFDEVQLRAVNRRGKSFVCSVVLSRMSIDGVPPCVVLLMEDRNSHQARSWEGGGA